VTELDLRPFACPLTWVKARIALERLAAGESMAVLLADGEPAQSVPESARLDGHALAGRERLGDGSWRVVLRKGLARSGAPGLEP
jgi:TusA-related sulfurtransferase